jgi:hypothetical protein
LWEEIDLVRPKVIITLGKTATSAVLGLDVPISKVTGKIQSLTVNDVEYSVIPCTHFSADLRSSGKFSGQISSALQLAHDLVTEIEIPVRTHVLNSNEEALSFLQGCLDLHEAGKLPYIAYDLEYDVLVGQDSRSEANRMSTLDIYNPERKLVAASFAYSNHEGYCIPLFCKGSKVDFGVILPLFRSVLEKIPVIAHNFLKAEGPWTMQKAGVIPKLHADTMLESFVIYMKTRAHGLKGLCKREFKWPDWSRDLDIQLDQLPKEDRSFRNVPVDVLAKYAAVDPVGCWALHHKFKLQMLFLVQDREQEETL